MSEYRPDESPEPEGKSSLLGIDLLQLQREAKLTALDEFKQIAAALEAINLQRKPDSPQMEWPAVRFKYHGEDVS